MLIPPPVQPAPSTTPEHRRSVRAPRNPAPPITDHLLTAPTGAAKAGVVGFTRALAYEAIEHGVNVNAVAPGPIDTDMLRGLSDEWRAMKPAQLPIGRFGRSEEIASTVLLLASDEGSYYVGQTLSPNGGDVML